MQSRKMGTVDCTQHQHSRHYTLNTIFIIKFAKKKKKKVQEIKKLAFLIWDPEKVKTHPRERLLLLISYTLTAQSEQWKQNASI